MQRVPCPHGTLVIGTAPDAQPHAGELAYAATLSPLRRRELVIGRAALREALGRDVAILPDDRGAPMLPAGWIGSVSHKGDVAAALVVPGDGARVRVGVDLERAAMPRQPIERRILTEHERAQIIGPRITLAFAIKEAIYKAVDPFVRRYVGFTEVELELGDNGACSVATALPFAVTAWWILLEDRWLATARAEPAEAAT
jgi:4'-phosphopantetheinyl transferase EntD